MAGLASSAWAGPDPCTIDGPGIVSCSGNQSAGISFIQQNVRTINVQNLSSTIAPAADTAGVALDVTAFSLGIPGGSGLSAPPLAVTVAPNGRIVTMGNAPAVAPAIGVTGTGSNATVGVPGDSSQPGGTAGSGGNGADITITTGATITASRSGRPLNTRAVEFGLTGELNQAAQQKTDAVNETEIRNFLRSATDDFTKAACGTLPCPASKLVDPTVRIALLGQTDSPYAQQFGSITTFPLIAKSDPEVQVQLRGASAIVDTLQANPLPQQVADRNGAVSGVSTGANGGRGGNGNSDITDPSATWNGGNGGTGGAGGAITISNSGAITTTAGSTYLHGILAESVGGSGGTGGNVTNILANDATPGAGGVGGAGGAIVITNSGAIVTSGGGAAGIFAESRGGTGGNGGEAGSSLGNGQNGATGGAGGAVSVTQSGSIVTQGAVAVGLSAVSQGGTGGGGNDGNGGTGGAAGNTTVGLTGSIITHGDSAYGLFAGSIGGTGGAGSGSSGSGGDGGAAGAVAITVGSGGTVTTAGANAHAVYGLSQGGSGGAGGSSSNFLWATSGGGGNGGGGGNVTITNAGTLHTSGGFAYGIFAQTLGGSGGFGGDAAGLFASSGAGGGGAKSGNVAVTNNGAIVTTGEGAHAILAQSIAGGGGDAGSATGLVALGANGSDEARDLCKNSPGRALCNDAGSVTVTNNGTLAVNNAGAFGIFAESIGAGGGNGGASKGLFAFGGSGGAGGNGGAIVVGNTGGITAVGDGTIGIFGQSVGGGGGNGGNASTFALGAGLALGGSGGGGGDGGAVTIANNGRLTVSGAGSSGIFAQSIGGGGGNGGAANTEGPKASALTVAIGGSGGDGGIGGTVQVTNNGTIAMQGDGATGVFAQSVGGGGGNGGSASASGVSPVVQISVSVGGAGGGGGVAGTVRVDNTGLIVTGGDRSRGVFAQSVGGGGGNGGDATAKSVSAGAPKVPVSVSLSIAVGGSGGTGGNGDSVTVNNSGLIQTAGERSHGLQAQSVGGGGGSGGSATASSEVMKSPDISVPISIAVGGKGGAAGDGGTVQVSNTGMIFTTGRQAVGVFVQSVGGGGGDGGSATSSATADPEQTSISIGVSVGGDGGGGGKGGAVTVGNAGQIVTTGEQATAVVAQSVGGGGGSGGNADASSTAKFSPSVAVGGRGGTGGDGGAVTVTNSGRLATGGFQAFGVYAESVGGGGGNGGSATTSASTDGNGGVSASVSVGGSGGTGGVGGTVSISNSGTIVTTGSGANGVFAQSVGGGGGSGGAAIATVGEASNVSGQTVQPSAFHGGSPLSVSVSVGGSGGFGGSGGAVTVGNTGSIGTAGDDAIAVFAQSVGGGGGVAGGATSTVGEAESLSGQAVHPALFGGGSKMSVSVSVGGSGGFGGAGGIVTVSNSGSIVTLGDRAIAVLAQSVGGGGGVGGAAHGESRTAADPGEKSVVVSVGVGGTAGIGGNGGVVSVVNLGTITTGGSRAFGVMAQSIGGGGGIGGGASATASDASYSLALGIGGDVGVAGNGGAVTVTNRGAITTMGAISNGIYAMSVGGGGGVGGDAISNASTGPGGGAIALGIGGEGGAAGNGGTVTITNSGRIDTFGYNAHGVFAQSVGGGGGSGAAGNAETSGGVNVGAGIGGAGGASGNGGAVQVSNTGTIMTRGNESIGIFAQSIGGGGGEGIGDGGSGSGQGSGIRSINVSVGGGAGASGNGGAITLAQTGDIVTLGTQSFGIMAQSIGGGGGKGGAGEQNKGLNIAVGGGGGAAGNGGAVAVAFTGNIMTMGDGAHAISAESIGGGGGVGGNVSRAGSILETFGLGATGSGGGAGNGGAVSVVSSGTIVTRGVEAFGIAAQSIGGGGGQAGSNDGSILSLKLGGSSGGSGTGGAVTVNHTGSIFALGTNARGIFAQSIGPDGNGAIAVTVNGGTVIGGSGTGSAILLDGGSTNAIAIGSGGSVSALSGTAIVSNGGAGIANTVNNAGTVTGNVRLGGGAGAANAFNNLAGGTFNTGPSVDLGGNGFQLTNGGLVEIAGRGSVGTTALTGGFTQSAGAVMGLDVRFGGASDRLTVSGNASIAGTVRPNNLFLMPTQTAVTVLTAGGTLTNNGASVISTPTITYGLDFNNIGGPGAMMLTINSVNFGGPANLTGNQRALGNYFQGLYNAGGAPQLAQLMGYLSNLNAGDYAGALERLLPTAYTTNVNTAAMTGLNFANALLSCYGFDGTYAAIREHECAWVRVSGSATTQAASSTNPGWHEEGVRVQAGAQFQMKPDWFVGLGVGYERASAGVGANNTTSVGTSRYNLGAILKYAPGPWLLAGALEAGYGNADTTRSIGLPAPSATAYSNSGIWHVDGKLRAAYLVEVGNVYAKPMADADLTYLYLPAFSEYGAGPLSLNVNSMSTWLFSATPAIEFGVTAIDGGDHVLRPRISVGATFFTRNSFSVDANLAGAPPGSAPFTTTTTFSSTVLRVTGGIDIFSRKQTGGLDIRLQYDGLFADGFQSHTGGAKFSMRF